MFVVQVSAYIYLQTVVKVLYFIYRIMIFGLQRMFVAPSPKNATRPADKTGLD